MRHLHQTVLTLFVALSLAPVVHAGDRDVTIPTADPEVTLAGTLSVPEEGEGPFPAVVLISGSGPQDRDSTVFGQRPFVVLAGAFVERGYAVLRYDDRGTGDSTGVFDGATIDEFIADAEGAVEWLAQQEEVDWRRTFALGHSEGSNVAAALGASGDVRAGVVMLAGAAVPGHEVMTDQAVRLARAQGADEAQCEAIGTAHSEAMRAVIDGAPDDELREKVEALIEAQTGEELPASMMALVMAQAMAQFESPWLRRYMEDDPSEDIRRLKVAGLAVFGGLDMQVSDDLNAAPMADALGATRNPDSRVLVFPGRNHLMQRARTGGVEEYGALDDLDPDVAHAIADWMDAVLGR